MEVSNESNPPPTSADASGVAHAHTLADKMRELLYIIQNLPREASTLQTAIGELESEIVSETELQALVSADLSCFQRQIEGFQEMMDKYIEKQFETNNLKKLYWDYIFSLQKYSHLRDILIPQRLANEKESLCCICMTEPVVIAMGPCGHTFCTNCSKRTIVCHICRQQITSRLRVYFN
jgi:hypothetical protein